MAIAATLITRQRFNDEYVDVVISTNDTFIRFHEAPSTVLVQKWEKRVVSDVKQNEKEGCTLITLTEMISL